MKQAKDISPFPNLYERFFGKRRPLWIQTLIEDCRAIVVERSFNSRMELITGYHELGERLNEDKNFKKYSRGNQKFIATVAKEIGVSTRTLYYAIAFYRRFPSLDALPCGKNISWRKITQDYLGSGMEKKTLSEQDTSQEIIKCPNCGIEIKLPLDK